MPILNHFILAGLVALTGALMGHALFDDLWLTWLAFLGAAVGGIASASLFGRDGPLAVVQATGGALLATSIGGGVGASLIAGPFAFLSGAILVWVSLVANPCNLTLFILAMSGVHQAARLLRSDFTQ